MRFLGGMGSITLEELFPWPSLLAVFIMTTFVVKNEIAKYNIAGEDEEESEERELLKARFEGTILCLSVVFSVHIFLESLINIRDNLELYETLIAVRVVASIVLAWTFFCYVNAQQRFKLKVAP